MTADPQTGSDSERSADFLVALRPLTLADPLRWLARGTRDFRQAPAIGLFFGGCFVAMGWALILVFENAPAYVLGLSAGFLLVVGPVLGHASWHAYRAAVEPSPRPA